VTRRRRGWRAFGPAAPPGRRPDAGSATVELAVSLPAMVLMLFVALSAIVAVRVQGECVDAAREAARAAARGEPAVGRRALPPGATVTLVSDGDTVRAVVTVRVTPLGGHLPGVTVAATAVAALEPGVVDAS
jgi:TadE-like protein